MTRFDARSQTAFGRNEALPGGFAVLVGSLSPALLPADPAERTQWFDALWDLRTVRPSVRMHGRLVEVPRWQQAYGDGTDYLFSGQVAHAEPLPAMLAALVAWARSTIDRRLNGALVNWYADRGDEIGAGRTTAGGDYIGPHRDSRVGLIDGAPIVTISLGGARVFRLRRYDARSEIFDIAMHDGTVIVLPFDTNLAFTHEVPRPRQHESGRRISVTLRAFEPGAFCVERGPECNSSSAST